MTNRCWPGALLPKLALLLLVALTVAAGGCRGKSGATDGTNTAPATRPAAGEEKAESLEGKTAPDFTLDTLDGGKVKLSDLKDNVVVLDFWATWCPPCRLSLPHLDNLARNKDLEAKGVKVLGINEGEEKERAASFIKEKNYAFTVPLDTEGAMMKEYRLQGIPTTIVIARGGQVHKVLLGFSEDKSPKELEDAIAGALKQDAPKASEKAN